MNDRGTLATYEPIRREKRDPDVVCLSHLRWNFVFQRPQHLLTRCAARRRVFYVEEPVFEAGPPRLVIEHPHPGVNVARMHLPTGLSTTEIESFQRQWLGELFRKNTIVNYVLWYYTPMALAFTEHLEPEAIVYDCMDELSAFAHAPAGLRERERDLLRRAHVVFTGGHSLYEAKRDLHHNIHPLPSSVDMAHFARARRFTSEPPDQFTIPHPRLGFFGVVDERLNIELLSAIAKTRPEWHLVILGPVVKIDPSTLPRRPNIHWLGLKSYDDLPHYLAGWDVALLPFARNDATRFISPTKTPEYLAAAKPVVSTSIRDVVRPYGELGFVHIADTPDDFVTAIAACLAEDDFTRNERQLYIDALLSRMSWDSTYERIEELLQSCLSVE
jgi:glycosyltransferase involved in cell wall biosynthesis